MIGTKTFDIGDNVLLLREMGNVFDEPLHAYVLQTQVHSRIYSYMVAVTGPNGKTRSIFVKEDWVRPADLIIQELPDTPWDEWLV